MISYLVWVVYSTRANRQRTALLAALTQQNNAHEAQLSAHTAITMPDNISLSSQASSSSNRDKKLSAVPGRVRSASMHRSTDSLNRSGRHHSLDRPFTTLSTVPVHQSNSSLAASSNRPHHRSAANMHRQAIGRSTLQINSTRQLAAAVATLPTFTEAVNKNNWVLDKNHSEETLLSNSAPGRLAVSAIPGSSSTVGLLSDV
ncbi:Hypothetical predicted protein [Cloeon dipterum]|nr:Hypothetical predicted protein [Cloeon dipterum]